MNGFTERDTTRTHSARRRTRWMISGAIAVLVVIALIVLVRRRSLHEPRRDTATAANATGMADMPGMTMGADGSAHLSAAQLRQFGVTFGTAERRTLSADVRAAGVVRVDETRLAQVAPKFGGFVERLHADFTGRSVARGEPLMEIYSPELLAAQRELLVARSLDRSMGEGVVPGVPGEAPRLAEAARRRLRLLDVSDAQIDDLLRTGVPRRTVTLHAPTSGVVLEKSVVRGQAVQAGQSLLTIADLSRVWVDAELRETDVASVRAGTDAQVELAALPGRTLTGRVALLLPVLDTTSRTVRARIVVANAGRLLRPGMFATVRLTTPARLALTVPSSAVVRTGERAIVFVDMGGGELMPHTVRLGVIAGEYTELLDGVEPGARVVTSAQYLLDSESNLGEVMRSMMSQTGRDMDMGGAPGEPGMTDKGADVKDAMKGMVMPSVTPSTKR